MSKFGFDYFVTRGSLLQEMARPVSVFTNANPQLKPFQDTYIQLMNRVGPYVGKDTGKRQFFIFDYLLNMLLDQIEPDLDQDVGAYAAELTGLARGFQSMKSALITLAAQNPEIVNSPQFINSALDDKNIQSHLGLRDARAGNRRTGYKNEVQNVLGTEHTNFEDIQQQAAPLVAQLNKIMGGRKTSRTRLGDASRFNNPSEQGSGDSDSNPNIDFAYTVLDSIDSLLENRQSYIEALDSNEVFEDELDAAARILVNSKTLEQDLKFLTQMYEKMISDGTGTTPEEFNAYMDKLSTMKGIDPSRSATFKLLKKEFNDLVDFSTGIKDEQLAHGGGKSYEGYDADVLAKVLDTPEKKQLFGTWYDYNQQWRQAKNEKLEQIVMRRMMQKNFFDRKGIEDDGSNYMSADIQALLDQQRKLSDFMQKETDPARKEAFANRIMDITKQIKYKRGEQQTPDTDNEDEESGVMGYMTEQVKKDTHNTKKSGQFVDRGFRKPVNYNHWLQINQ